MKKENIFKVSSLIVNIKKEECEALKEFTKTHNIIMKIGNFKEYPILFPTKINIWYDKIKNIHIASLSTTLHKLYDKDSVEIDFKNINLYLK